MPNAEPTDAPAVRALCSVVHGLTGYLCTICALVQVLPRPRESVALCVLVHIVAINGARVVRPCVLKPTTDAGRRSVVHYLPPPEGAGMHAPPYARAPTALIDYNRLINCNT